MIYNGYNVDYALIINTRYHGAKVRGAKIVATYQKARVSVLYGNPEMGEAAHHKAAGKCLQHVVGELSANDYALIAYGDGPHGGYAFVFQKRDVC